jgi:catechol 2,3-dioxygenase-like lactoylglutathione lyase family enzyme
MQITGTHHVALCTTDVARLRQFYVETLGLPVVGAFEGHNIVFIGAGSTTIELLECAGPAKAGQGGWDHLALEVADLGAAYDELTARGVVFFVQPEPFPEAAPFVRLAFFRDPDGNAIELVQPLGSRYPSAHEPSG